MSTSSDSRADRDPSGFYGTVVVVIAAVLAVLTAFGVPLTDGQQEAILQLLTVSGPLVTAWLIRRKAWAPSTVDHAITTAYDFGTHDRDADADTPPAAVRQVVKRRVVRPRREP